MSNKRNDRSDDEASDFHSVAGSSRASTTSTEFTSFSSILTPTVSEEKQNDEKKKKEKPLPFISEESADDLSDYDEDTDEFLGGPPAPPSQKFPGKLASGEKWLRCPYYAGHFYMYVCTLFF